MINGERLRELRKSQRMTLEDVAGHLHVGRATVLRYENGMITNVPSDKIEIMARLFDVSPAYIMGWSDDPKDDGTAARAAELPSSELIKKVIINMTPQDYEMVMDALNRTEKRMKKEGKL